MGASKSMNKDKIMDASNSKDISNSIVTINGKDASNSKQWKCWKYTVNLFCFNLEGSSGTMVEYSIYYLKVISLRSTSPRKNQVARRTERKTPAHIAETIFAP